MPDNEDADPLAMQNSDDEFHDGPETLEHIEAQMRRNRIAFARRLAQIKPDIAVTRGDSEPCDDDEEDAELELRFGTTGPVLRFADGSVARVKNDGATDGDADGTKDNTTQSGT